MVRNSTETRDQILKLLEDRGELTTMEVSDLTGLTMPVARSYLKTLVFEDKVAWRRLGQRVLAWRLKKQ